MQNEAHSISYSVAIRTIGKSGELFNTLITSLKQQTVQPEGIWVYIAEGYERPQQVADEQYVVSAKGMVTQRALPFDEIDSEWILLCDDDMAFAPDSVQKLLETATERGADCITPDFYYNYKQPLGTKLKNVILYGTLPTCSRKYAFRIRRSSYFSYCDRPFPVMETQSMAGGSILIRKKALLAAKLAEEKWLETYGYAFGDDQILAYKLFRQGRKLLIHFDSGVVHNDARTGQGANLKRKDYGDQLLRHLIWYRSIYEPDRGLCKILDRLSYDLWWCWFLLVDIIIGVLFKKFRHKPGNLIKSRREARQIIRSGEFQSIPKWKTVR